jgi:hypothetical protein
MDYDPNGTNDDFNLYLNVTFIPHITAELESFRIARTKAKNAD